MRWLFQEPGGRRKRRQIRAERGSILRPLATNKNRPLGQKYVEKGVFPHV